MADNALGSKQSAGTAVSKTKQTQPSGGRWFVRGLFLMGLLATTVWFAPTIVAQTSLRQRIPKLIFPTYPGNVEVGETSIGWFSPIVVHGLKAEDGEGRVLLEAKEFSTVETLWTLATRQTNLGRMKLIDPVVNVAIRADGSNVEDVYTAFMSGPASTAPVPAFELEIVNARIDLENIADSRKSTIEAVSLVMASTRGGVDDLELTIGQVPEKTETEIRDSLEAVGDWLAIRIGNRSEDDADAATTSTQHVRLLAKGWKLDKLAPALARFEPNADLHADLNLNVKVRLQPTKTSTDWSWSGTASLQQLELAGLTALKNDRIVMNEVSLEGQIASDNGRLAMDNLRISTDVGDLTATGAIPLASLLSPQAMASMQSVIDEEDFQLDGHVDLKRLAALLPQTLRIREGTEITSGQLEIKFIGDESEGVRGWKGGASVSELTANNRGEVITWKTPLVASFQAHRQDGLIVVDRLACQSDFLQVSGSGTLTDARFTASGDLTKLEQNIERFIDLGLEHIAGRLRVNGSIKREGDEKISLNSTVNLDQFQWQVDADDVWREDQLELVVTAAAKTDGGTTLQEVDSASLKLTSGTDSLSAQLTESIAIKETSASWPVSVAMSGNLSTWQNRVRPFAVLSGWQLGGDANIEAQITANPSEIHLERLDVDIKQLQARGPEWLVQEPQLKLQSSGVWKTADSEWSSPQTTLAASSVSCRIDKLNVALDKSGAIARMSGNAAYRADLDKLSRWKNQALEHPTYHLIGSLSGRAIVSNDASVMTADMETSVEKMVVAALQTHQGQPPKWEALWREPKLSITGKGRYDSASDELQVENSSLSVDGLNVTAKGVLAKASTSQNADVSGMFGYDWDVLVKRFGAAIGKNVQLSGSGERPFSLKGPLASLSATNAEGTTNQLTARTISATSGVGSNKGNSNRTASPSPIPSDLSGEAGLGWQSAMVYGLTVGPGDLSAKLENGICQFAPLDFEINEGRLHFTPQIRLDQTPSVIVLPQEQVINHVRLSPELCSSWLKYVMPMLADATEVEGKFSVAINEGTLPLMDPAIGEMKGAVSIHQAQVRPGPSSMQLVNLVDQIRAVIRQRPAGDPNRERVLMQMPEQTVDFNLSQGRMHHRPITIQIRDVTLRTSGWVGMDETLSLTAEFGIPDDWIGNTKLLAGLKGKTIRIPIGGTLTRPLPDGRVLGELTKQVGGSALEGLFEKEIDNKLDGILKKKLKLLPE